MAVRQDDVFCVNFTFRQLLTFKCVYSGLPRYEHMMRRMREAPRPLKLTFEKALSPAAKMTAAIKYRAAAAVAAATSISSGKRPELLVLV